MHTHTHRVWTVRYNRCHDQLLLSGGTDSLLNLWRVSSVSSAPLLEMDDAGGWVGTQKQRDKASIPWAWRRGHWRCLLSCSLPHSRSRSLPNTHQKNSSDAPDVLVKAFGEHEESVYALAWSAADPFLFASASYDGKVVVNAVPPSQKYKILL